MKIAEADILIVPGLGNADEGHWQRRWQEKMANAQWVEQDNWTKPKFDEWTDTIERRIVMATRPVVLVAHAVGVAAAVHTAQRLADTKVRGAFFVCPPDLDEDGNVPKAAKAFANVPRDPLPFPSLLIASSNDDTCSVEKAADLANAWGSDFHVAGEVGHVNVASGHGPWPEGLMMFTRLMQRLKA